MAFSAPFGTDVQPGIDIKIVGGRRVEVHQERVKFPEVRSLKRNSPVLQSSPSNLYTPPWAFNDHLPKTPPRKILKPIGETDSPVDVLFEDRHVPFAHSSSVLPPIHGRNTQGQRHSHNSNSSEEDSALDNSLKFDLKTYDQRRLKELYISITSFDPQLTGYVSPAQLENIFIRNHVPIRDTVLKPLINKFSTGRNDDKVNYEDVLGYLNKFASASANDGPVPKLNLSALGANLSPRNRISPHSTRDPPLTLSPTEISPRDNLSDSGRSSSLKMKRAFANREDAQLRMQVEQLFKPYRERVGAELAALRSDFQDFDRFNVEFIKQEQLKSICLRGSLPFNDSMLNKLVGRVSRSQTEKVNWKQFMDFLESIVPATMMASPSPAQSKPGVLPSKPVWETRQPLQPLHKRQHSENSSSSHPQQLEDQPDLDDATKAQLEKEIHQKLKRLPKDHVKIPQSTESLSDQLQNQEDEMRLKTDSMDYELIDQKVKEHALREKFLKSELKKEGFTCLILALLNISYVDKTGFIDSVEAWRLITNHNLVHTLELSQDSIDKALSLCTRQNGIKVCVKHLVEALHPAGLFNAEDWEKKLLWCQPCDLRYH